jgi:hypothetical protein
LRQKGKIIIAEVDRKPIFKYFLGWVTDHILYPGDKILYRFPAEFWALFTKLGFKAKILRADKGKPFAHVIYILRKNEKNHKR